jgi:hypothetical protein
LLIAEVSQIAKEKLQEHNTRADKATTTTSVEDAPVDVQAVQVE